MQHIYEESKKKAQDSSLNRQNGRLTMKKVRILLVGENEFFRRRIRHSLEQEEDMEIVGDCTSAEEALSQVETLFPNVVLIDAWLPGMDGIEACRRLAGNGHAYDVILLTTGQELMANALTAQAAGFFPKELKQGQLVTAIRLAYKWQSRSA